MLALVALLVGGLAAGPGAAQTSPGAAPGELLYGAVIRATIDDPACERDRRRGPARLVGDAPAPETAAAFAALRRPRRAGDRYPRAWLRSPMVGTVILARSVRVLRAEDGTRSLLAISRSPRSFGLPLNPDACAAARRERLQALGQGGSPEARAEALALLERDLAYERADARGEHEFVEWYSYRAPGRIGGGGAGLAADIRVRGTLQWGPERVRGKRRLVVAGLLPDEVASVVVREEEPRGRRRVGPRTVRVRENTFHLVVPRGLGPRVVVDSRARNGRVLRRFRLF